MVLNMCPDKPNQILPLISQRRPFSIIHAHSAPSTGLPQIRVYCRVRPHASPVVRCAPDQCSIAIAVDGREHGFTYDRVYAPQANQEEVRGRGVEVLD